SAISGRTSLPCDDDHAASTDHFWKLHRHPWWLGGLRVCAQFQHRRLHPGGAAKRGTLGFVFGNDQERRIRLDRYHHLVQRRPNSRRWGRRRWAGYYDIRGASFARNVSHERGAHGHFLFCFMNADGKPMIEVDGLIRKFGDRAVLNDISFNVHRGDTLVIMGGSGCGKSTLLRHMIGSMKPTSGTVKLFGEELTRMRERELIHI